MESWSAEFRQVANLLMASPHPGALFWGPDLTMMYNEAYRDGVAGLKHPELMGTGFKGPFAELWDTVGEIFAECARTGKAVAMVDQMLPIERHGFLEETYFSWCFVPLYEGYNTPRGFWNAPFETTRQVTNSRRTQLLRVIGEEDSLAKSIKEFWVHTLRGLQSNQFDVPFALLYSVVEDGTDSDSTSVSSAGSDLSQKSCVFEGSLGIPEGHTAAPKRLDLHRASEGFIPSFREALRTREPTMLVSRDGSLPEALLNGIQWRGFPEPCREAVIFPLRPTNGESVVGFLLLGINPRRPYDDDYKSFVYMLDRQLATSIASVMLFEDEIRAGRTAAESAAIERANLTAQLDIQTKRLQRMTEESPVGLFFMNQEGLLLEANDVYYEMTTLSKNHVYNMSWMNIIVEDQREYMTKSWYQMAVEGRPWSGELQLTRTWKSDSGEEREYWILAAAHPEFDSEGKVTSVMGSITDISSQKYLSQEALSRARLSEELALRTQEAAKSEQELIGLQNRRLEEAEATRRQQNNFIDIVSHEMRNPIGAILGSQHLISFCIISDTFS
jgi:PAS domain S-box-containing protein